MVRHEQGVCFGSASEPVVENKSEETLSGSGIVQHGGVVVKHVSNGEVKEINFGAGIE